MARSVRQSLNRSLSPSHLFWEWISAGAAKSPGRFGLSNEGACQDHTILAKSLDSIFLGNNIWTWSCVMSKRFSDGCSLIFKHCCVHRWRLATLAVVVASFQAIHSKILLMLSVGNIPGTFVTCIPIYFAGDREVSGVTCGCTINPSRAS